MDNQPAKPEKYSSEISSLGAQSTAWKIATGVALVAGAVLFWEVATEALLAGAVVAAFSTYKAIQKGHQKRVLEKAALKDADLMQAMKAQGVAMDVPASAQAQAQPAQERPAEYWQSKLTEQQAQQPAMAAERA